MPAPDEPSDSTPFGGDQPADEEPTPAVRTPTSVRGPWEETQGRLITSYGTTAIDEWLHRDREKVDGVMAAQQGEEEEEEEEEQGDECKVVGTGEYRRVLLGLAARAVAVHAMNSRMTVKRRQHRSCFFVGQHNPLRVRAKKLVSHRVFTNSVLALIILNSVTLALDSPDLRDVSDLQSFLTVSEVVFVLCFGLEMLLKIFANGLYGLDESYLSSGWNILDGITVLVGALNLSFTLLAGGDAAANVSAIRLLRVLRPLRTVSRIKGMRVLVNALVGSLGGIVNVFFLLTFLLIVFAIAGIQLWSETLHQRCYLNGVSPPTLDNSESLGCSKDPTGFQCPPGSVCAVHEEHTVRFLNFDHLASAMFTVFKAITLDDWPEDLWRTQNTYMHISWMYYFILVLAGAYFAVNLFLAVLSKHFEISEKEDAGDGKGRMSAVVSLMQSGTGRVPLSVPVVVERPKAEPSEDEDPFQVGAAVQVYTLRDGEGEEAAGFWEPASVYELESDGFVVQFADGELWRGVPSTDVRLPPEEDAKTCSSGGPQLEAFRFPAAEPEPDLGSTAQITANGTRRAARDSFRGMTPRGSSGALRMRASHMPTAIPLGGSFRPFSVILREDTVLVTQPPRRLRSSQNLSDRIIRNAGAPQHGPSLFLDAQPGASMSLALTSHRRSLSAARLPIEQREPCSPQRTASYACSGEHSKPPQPPSAQAGDRPPLPVPMRRTHCVRGSLRVPDVVPGVEEVSSEGTEDGREKSLEPTRSRSTMTPLSTSTRKRRKAPSDFSAAHVSSLPAEEQSMHWSQSVTKTDLAPSARSSRRVSPDAGPRRRMRAPPPLAVPDPGVGAASVQPPERLPVHPPDQAAPGSSSDGDGDMSEHNSTLFEDQDVRARTGSTTEARGPACPFGSRSSIKHDATTVSLPSVTVTSVGATTRRRPKRGHVKITIDDKSSKTPSDDDRSPFGTPRETAHHRGAARLSVSELRVAEAVAADEAVEQARRRASIALSLQYASRRGTDASRASIAPTDPEEPEDKKKKKKLVQWIKRPGWDAFGDEDPVEEKEIETGNKKQILECREMCLGHGWGGFAVVDGVDVLFREQTTEELIEHLQDVGDHVVFHIAILWESHENVTVGEEETLPGKYISVERSQDVCADQGFGGFTVHADGRVRYHDMEPDCIRDCVARARTDPSAAIEAPGAVLYVPASCKTGNVFVHYTRKLVHWKAFDHFMLFVTILNVAVLGADHYGINDTLVVAIETINTVCTLIFTFEIVAKLVGLGVSMTFRDPYNRFDAFLVAVGIPQLIVGWVTGNGGGNILSVFRLLRVARVLRLARRWTRLRKIILIVLESMSSVAYLSLLLLLIMFIYAVMGMQLFGTAIDPPPPTYDDCPTHPVDCPVDHPKRLVFSSLWKSLLTVFIVITGESWVKAALAAMEDAGWPSAFFFISLFVVGRYIILNLFVAIIIERFQQERETERARVKQKKDRQRRASQRSVDWGSRRGSVAPTALPGRDRLRSTRAGSFWSWGRRDSPRRLSASGFSGITEGMARAEESRVLESDDGSHCDQTDAASPAAAPLLLRPLRTEEPESPVVTGVADSVACVAALAVAAVAGPAADCAGEMDALPDDHPANLGADSWNIEVHSPASPASPVPEEKGGFRSLLKRPRPTPLQPVPADGEIGAGSVRFHDDSLPKRPAVERPNGARHSDPDAALLVPDGAGAKDGALRHSVVEGAVRRASIHPDAIQPRRASIHPDALDRRASTAASPDKDRERKSRSVFELRLMGATTVPSQPRTKVQFRSATHFHEDFPNLREVAVCGKPQLVVSDDFVEDSPTQRAVAGIEGGHWQVKEVNGRKVKTLAEVDEALYMCDDDIEVELLHWASLDDDVLEAILREAGDSVEQDIDPLVLGEVTCGPMCNGWWPGFSHDGSARQFLTPVLLSPAMDTTIVVLIAANLVVLGTECPATRATATSSAFFYWSDFGFTFVFLCEMIAKMIVVGVWGTAAAYLKDLWNVVDFVVVTTSLLGFLIPPLQLFRSFRVFRLVTRSENVKVVLYAVVGAMPSVFNGLVVCAFAFILFAILGVQIFKGIIVECNDPTVLHRVNCTGNYTVNATGELRERVWSSRDWNFDHLGNALFTLFKLSLSEQWISGMFAGMDASDHDTAPQREYRPYMSIYYVVFFVVSNFLCLNLIISILISSFQDYHEARFFQSHGDEGENESDGESTTAVSVATEEDDDDDEEGRPSLEERKRMNQARTIVGGWHQDMRKFDKMKGFQRLLTDKQREWVRAQQLLVSDLTTYYRAPEDPFRKRIFRLVESQEFERGIAVAIMLNLALLCTQHRGQSKDFTLTFEILNNVFVDVYIIEFALKWAAYTFKNYIADGWNRFDFGVLMISLAGLGIGESLTVFRVMRIGRVLRLFRMMRGLNKMFTALLYALPPLFNIGLLLCCVFFVFGVLGVEMFGALDLELNPVLSRNINFRNLPEAVLLLFQISTAEFWIEVLRGCEVREPECKQPDCGTDWAILYFVMFMVCVSFLMINLFVAVVLDAFNDADDVLEKTSQGPGQKKEGTGLVVAFRNFRRQWLEITYPTQDPELMEVHQFIKMVGNLGAPLGPTFKEAGLVSYLRELNIPVDATLCVHYTHAAHALARKAFNIQLDEAFRFSNLSAVKVTDDMFTVVHVYCVRRIATQWRKLVARKKREQEHDFPDVGPKYFDEYTGCHMFIPDASAPVSPAKSTDKMDSSQFDDTAGRHGAEAERSKRRESAENASSAGIVFHVPPGCSMRSRASFITPTRHPGPGMWSRPGRGLLSPGGSRSVPPTPAHGFPGPFCETASVSKSGGSSRRPSDSSDASAPKYGVPRELWGA